ncbi:hypothetical protein [Actinoplanes xinjiangensis]|uniref:hypothetical protein n=1 Tax=Actinoplanes xinjiangensis TaxID=512350 RepID=UPI003447876A
MFSYPTFEQVLDDLGEKVVNRMSLAAFRTRADLVEYRRLRPNWVADHSERGLANWLHDRFWAQLVVALDDVDGVDIIDQEPVREFYVGYRYRLRVKRHQTDGSVSAYPTLASLSWFMQEQPIEGLEEIRLATGYEWDAETRGFGEAVLSLRDGRDKIIWYNQLPPPQAASVGPDNVKPLGVPPVAGPSAPRIGLESDAETAGNEDAKKAVNKEE